MSERFGMPETLYDKKAAKFDWFDLVVLGTTFSWSVVESLSGALSALDDATRGHSNWRRGRQELTEDVMDGIDRLL